ncbi:MAG: hypothetical protein ACI39R_04410 [Lachnospiraceae bacterium]
MKKERYNSKKLKRHASGTELVYRKRRLLLIALWLLLCVGIGVWIFKDYAAQHMSDTPVKAQYTNSGVTTGNELKEDVPFGPWMAEPAGK